MNLTEEEKSWFNGLQEIRLLLKNALELSAAGGVKKESGDDKYSDQAHFIYELIQNASDVKAKVISFKLFNHGLYFIHDGTIHFTISQPDTIEDKKIEERDSKLGKLGHVNAICSIGNSSKKIEPNNIGKFGVGFKSVFQYSKTPHIYDKKFKFKITDFIVPELLNEDLKDRKENETVFYLPFDNEDMPSELAFEEISTKLKNLKYPLLFVNNLKEINWEIDSQEISEKGLYLKEEKLLLLNENIVCNKIILCQQVGSTFTNEELIVFNRMQKENILFYSIAYLINEKGLLEPKEIPAFCFFQTKEVTNLNFMIHAPFLLNDSRESIHSSKEHNIKMIKDLSTLAADSLLILRDMKLIDDNIFDIIPYKKPLDKDFFKDFYYKIKEKFQTEALIPSNDGTYVNKENAFWFQDKPIIDLFENEHLQILLNNKNAKWTFTLYPRNQFKARDLLREYLDVCVNEHYEMENLLRKLNENFINQQSYDWLHKLYAYLGKNLKTYERLIKEKPIFKDIEGKACSAFENKNGKITQILFFPNNANSNYKYINDSILNNETTLEFLKDFGFKVPDLKDEIYHNILPKYYNLVDIDTAFKDFVIIYCYWLNEGKSEDFINYIKDIPFLVFKCKDTNVSKLDKASDLYYPTNDLVSYFENKTDTKFIAINEYMSLMKGENEKQFLKDFLKKLGLREVPKVYKSEKTDSENKDLIQQLDLKRWIYIHNRRNAFSTKIIDYTIENLESCLSKENINISNSFFIWRIINNYEKYFTATFIYATGTYTTQTKGFDSNIMRLLKSKKWLYSKSNEFVSPLEITINDLHYDYNKNNQLEKLLSFKPILVLTKEQEIASIFYDDMERALRANKALDKIENAEKKKIERLEIKKEVYTIKNEINIVLRKNNVIERHKENDKKEYKIKEQSERVFSEIRSKAKLYLKEFYGNTEILLCQICDKKMPFRYKSNFYFEAVELFNFTLVKREAEEVYLCLCPICSKKYKLLRNNNYYLSKIKNKLLEIDINNEKSEYIINLDFETNLSPSPSKISFVREHIIDIQAILEVEEENNIE